MQQSLDKPEAPRATADAARPLRPITGRMVLRILAIGSGIGVFLSLLGPFTPVRAFLTGAGERLAYSWIGSLLGLLSARTVLRLGLASRGLWAMALATGLGMTLPMTAVVWLVTSLAEGGPPPLGALPAILWRVALVCVGASWLAVLVARSGQTAPAAPAPVRFLERLPLKLRGGELWAVEAEDHYLRLHTSKGQDLILLRLADAIDELAGIEGAQVHRSWWVAREAIADARRGDGRATLTLKDGSQVPVSRTYARALRERNWI